MSERTEADILWERALEPPQGLIDYRFVMEGRPPANRNQVSLEAEYREKPSVFRSNLRAEEKAYREALAKMVGAKGKAAGDSPLSPGEEDEGTDRVLELLAEEWKRVLDIGTAEEARREPPVPGLAARQGGGQPEEPPEPARALPS